MSFPGKTYNNKMALTFRGVVVLLLERYHAGAHL